tara:strand:+ start:564 stop:1034 length:471 start_codon:yes stop_codon:yes gene_type:complete
MKKFKMQLPPILLSYVSESFILFLYKLFKKQKEFQTNNITENCVLTNNLIESIPSEYRQQIVKDFFPYDALFHLHILKYPKGGELNDHTHIEFEKKSYIVYMDDVGGTVIKMPEGELFVKSERRKIIWFNSEFPHKAITNNQIRYVAAGGIYQRER